MDKQDRLVEMFRLQRALNERIGVHLEALSPEQEQEWVLNYCRAMSQELAELVDSVPWKWWARYQTYDRDNARVEVVDMFHFLISLAQALGLEAEDIFDLYTRKHAVNVQRQESGYSVKDETDNADIRL